MNVARAGSLVMAALLVSACSGGDDAAPTTVLETLAPTTVPTTITTTSLPTTTAPPVTTATATTATPTIPTTAPTTTIPPDAEQVKRDIIAAANASLAIYLDAARNPTDGSKIGRLPDVMTGQTLELAVDLIADLVTSGRIAVENPDVPAAITTFYEDTFTYDPATATASIEYCRIGSDLGIIPGGNPDGSDQIVVNEVNAYRERSDFVFVDGRWLDTSGVSLQKFEGTTECAPP